MLAVENNWFQTNMLERVKNHKLPFEVCLKRTPFERRTFHDACAYAAREITKNYGDVYMALSGGMDSRYAFKCLVEAGNKVTPIIVLIDGNSTNIMERKYALADCKNYGIMPHLVNITEIEHLSIYYADVVRPLNGSGVFSVPSVMASKLAKLSGRVMVTGDNVVNYEHGYGVLFDVYEHDYYSEAHAPGLVCPFFEYTPAIVYASARQLDEREAFDNEAATKNALYQGTWQPVLPNGYDDPEVKDLLKAIKATTRHPPKRHFFGSRDAFLSLFDDWAC